MTTPTPIPSGESQAGQAAPQQQPTVPTPPWGDNFDAQRAWDLVQNLRGDKDKLKNDLTQAAADREELERLRGEKLSADERALKDARKDAADAAAKAAADTYLPQLQAAKVEAVAARVLKDEKRVEGFMAVVDPAKFVGENGEIDPAKVTTALNAMFGQQSPHGQRWQNAGQGIAPAPQSKPGEAGKAEAQKRAAARKTNTT